MEPIESPIATQVPICLPQDLRNQDTILVKEFVGNVSKEFVM